MPHGAKFGIPQRQTTANLSAVAEQLVRQLSNYSAYWLETTTINK